MKIGVMYSGVPGLNGADYVAYFLKNAFENLGYDTVEIGQMGGRQADEIPSGLDFIVHSSGYGLDKELVEKFKKKTKVFLWTHNDEMPFWVERISPITNVVDKHFIYTKNHSYDNPSLVYLPIGADESIYYPKKMDKVFDICLVGSARQWRVNFISKIARHFPKSYFNLNMSMPFDKINDLYNSTKVVIAPIQDCDEDIPGKAWGCPCRTFDVPASDAFQINVSRGGLSDVYPMAISIHPELDVDKAVELWSDKISYWINNEKERNDISKILYNHTIKNNLYKNRAIKIIETYEEMA